MGAVVMVSALAGLIVLIVALVVRYDPEARGPRGHETSADE